MSKPTKKFLRWQARRLESAINARLVKLNNEGRVVIRYASLKRYGYEGTSWVIQHLTGPSATAKERLTEVVNKMLRAPVGGLPQLEATAECPKCGKEVELWAEPQEWQRQRDGRFKVTAYWPAEGTCCGDFFVDDPFSGCRWFQLPASLPAGSVANQHDHSLDVGVELGTGKDATLVHAVDQHVDGNLLRPGELGLHDFVEAHAKVTNGNEGNHSGGTV